MFSAHSDPEKSYNNFIVPIERNRDRILLKKTTKKHFSANPEGIRP
jgi:hypothetical protein